MFGFMGKILDIDLTTKSVRILENGETFYKQHLGGAFMAAKLFESAVAGNDRPSAFDNGNPLVFATGPLAGTGICGSTRVNILAVSPETRGIYTSQAGGEFGPDIKRAGYDALVIRGASARPVFLDIVNDRVLFADAGHLRGQDRLKVFEQLSAGASGKVSIASIGPAGENRVRHANIMFEPDHYAGRGGLGAVMGAKQLKAIRIGGDQTVAFKDDSAVKAVNRNGASSFSQAFAKNPRSFLAVLKTYGTFGLLMLNQGIGNLPVNNYKRAWMDDAAFNAAIAHDRIGETVVGKRNPCHGCYLGCKKTSAADAEHSALAEYESMAMLGPNLGIRDLKAIMDANELCNRLGLDTISTGALISYLMDGFESGDLDEAQVGYCIRFGQAHKVVELIRMMAHRQGELGNLLADGIETCIAVLGAHTRRHLRFAAGVGLPAHMPRAKPGIGFGYLHGPNPGDHMKAEHDWIASSPDDLRAFGIDATSAPFALDRAKVAVYRATQIYYAAMDSLSLCLFIFGPGNIYSYDDILKMVNAAIDGDFTFDDLMHIGERAVQLQRRLYLAYGGSDSELPAFMQTAIPDGPTAGNKLSATDFTSARAYYYQIWGWDVDGRPSTG